MQKHGGFVSPSGVLIADDFRENLIIDRHDPVFADMRASKIKHLRSANSEDAVTFENHRVLAERVSAQHDHACLKTAAYSPCLHYYPHHDPHQTAEFERAMTYALE